MKNGLIHKKWKSHSRDFYIDYQQIITIQKKRARSKKQGAMAKSNLNQLQELTDKLSNLENAIKGLSIKPSGNKEKKPRNMTDAGALHKAKLIYYQEMKNSNEVKALLKAQGLDDISFKNWRVAKEVTDKMFDKLSLSTKENYTKKAEDSQRVS